ncbi:MAG: hypothetical protein AAF495_10605 [Pseudomonadota bacterium]
MTQNAFVLPLVDGRLLVYPHAYLGAGYLLSGWQRAGYESWVQERRESAGGGRRLMILAALGGVPLVASFVLDRIAPKLLMIGFLMSFLVAVWAVLAVLQHQFRQAFPEAVRAPRPRPWRRIFKGLLVSRACHLWRCVLFFVIGVSIVVYPALVRVSYWRVLAEEAPDQLVFQLATLLVWLAFIGVTGVFIVQHILFRRRHRRAPRPEDLEDLL